MRIIKTKNTGSILIGILFLLSSSGLFLTQHYCMGKIKGVSLKPNTHHSDFCSDKMHNKHCGDHLKKDCCEDEVVEIDTDEYITISNAIQKKSIFPLLSIGIALQEKSYNPFTGYYPAKIYKPPPIRTCKIQVLYQSFLI
ncbi:MAG: hypothetical protein OEY34_06065 [Cyclobacteriaceae bacterium]|nr:hypothetical protein [Cyclobacteriaceae bacterium]